MAVDNIWHTLRRLRSLGHQIQCLDLKLKIFVKTVEKCENFLFYYPRADFWENFKSRENLRFSCKTYFMGQLSGLFLHAFICTCLAWSRRRTSSGTCPPPTETLRGVARCDAAVAARAHPSCRRRQCRCRTHCRSRSPNTPFRCSCTC